MSTGKYSVLLLAAFLIAPSLMISGCDSSGEGSNAGTPSGPVTKECKGNGDCDPPRTTCQLKDGKNQCVAVETPVVTECKGDGDCDPPRTTCQLKDGKNQCVAVETPAVTECKGDGDCDPPRTTCQLKDGKNQCVAVETPAVTGSAYGEPCTVDSDCAGGACKYDGKWKELGGYCTRLNCATKADCVGGGTSTGLCVKGLANESMCMKQCRVGHNEDCRDGFECIDNGTEGVCYPEIEQYPGNSTENTEGVTCIDFPRDNVAQDLNLNIPDGVSSFLFTGWTLDDSAKAYITYLKGAGGAKIDFTTVNTDVLHYIKLYSSWKIGSLSTTPFMAPLYPQLDGFVHSGNFQVRVGSDKAGTFCYRLISEKKPGNTIDINVYLVGVKSADGARDLTVEEAKTDPALARMFNTVNGIYNKAGLNVRVKRYYTLSPKLVERYRSYDRDRDLTPGSLNREMMSLFQRSLLPGSTKDDLLSVNVFFVETILSRNGTVGVSGGIPGVAGAHGLADSGLVFTSSYLRGQAIDSLGNLVDGAEFTGSIIAHELGHYLGLSHTSESRSKDDDGTGPKDLYYDMLSDTTECSKELIRRDRNWWDCPDVGNLMFPVAGSGKIISPMQADVLKASVLTK